MKNNNERYVLGADVMTSTGMNIDIALSVAKADLGLFNQKVSSKNSSRISYANIEYLEATKYEDKCAEMAEVLIESLLTKLPKPLKPIPLYISISKQLSPHEFKDKLELLESNRWISHITVVQDTGIRFFEQSLEALNKCDALMSIAIDSMHEQLDALLDDNLVLSDQNPWGVIPSEGAAGVILTKRNIIDTLKLVPQASFGQLFSEHDTSDRRSMMRLIRRASKQVSGFGRVYSDMTNMRKDTEDYGFALGARAEKFINPQRPFLINDLWGTMGNASVYALIATFIREQNSEEQASLLFFDHKGDRGLITMQKNTIHKIGS
ncbi:hypothetical protein L4C54_11665 [Vibrio lamellibrachiae]|uniref:hypothetical protein n=1 Tax=Vibrio lamellibrachiae TaxID=2910253 RepID=UPI003D0C2F6F